MKKSVSVCVFMLSVGSALIILATSVAAPAPAPTPTADPFIEPLLPENPTELELGRNLYWHWCMPCHGDQGQGLTDEWRSAWVSDHQNCWARGCHAGHNGDTAFPIPTIVPALTDENQLKNFADLATLNEYLKNTHPPQHPGLLEDKEYHAIAFYVFSMNGRPTLEIPPTRTTQPTPPASPMPKIVKDAPQNTILAAFLLILVMLAIVFLVLRRNKNR